MHTFHLLWAFPSSALWLVNTYVEVVPTPRGIFKSLLLKPYDQRDVSRARLLSLVPHLAVFSPWLWTRSDAYTQLGFFNPLIQRHPYVVEGPLKLRSQRDPNVDLDTQISNSKRTTTPKDTRFTLCLSKITGKFHLGAVWASASYLAPGASVSSSVERG